MSLSGQKWCEDIQLLAPRYQVEWCAIDRFGYQNGTTMSPVTIRHPISVIA